ncbi:MAG: 4Fe-4S dicluster domain-containing protein [Candidatus Hodarchaeota archaeon]
MSEVQSAPKVRIYVMGREDSVPSGLTIMKAMEYVGYRFIGGCGCRGGFCGACATVYKIKGDYKLNVALACQEIVKDGMYLAILPFTPAEKATYDLEKLAPSRTLLLEHYPEIAKCVSCNTCKKACPQNIEVMDVVQASLRGDIEKAAILSFDCIHCGLCAMRCPASIVPYQVAQLARRICGKYIAPRSRQLSERIQEIKDGKFEREMDALINASIEELKERYIQREIEK